MMMVRNELILILGLMTTLPVAAEVDRCESVFQAVLDSKKFPTTDSKLRFLQESRNACEGTGLYESRLAYFYVEAKDFSSAAKVLKAGLSKPNAYHKQLKFGLADLDLMTGKVDQATASAQKLKDEYVDWGGGYLLLAKIMLMQRRFEESIRYANEANQRNPDAGTYLGLATAYHQLGRDVEAVDAANAAIRLDPSVVGRAPGMNEAIYSLVRLVKYEDAAVLAMARVSNDSNWSNDSVFVKALKYLETKGVVRRNK